MLRSAWFPLIRAAERPEKKGRAFLLNDRRGDASMSLDRWHFSCLLLHRELFGPQASGMTLRLFVVVYMSARFTR